MKYLELINKCLVELNYKKVGSFSELIKNEHKKLQNILNVINSEVCTSARWDFLLRKKEMTIPANTPEIENNIEGRIETVIIDGVVYCYCADFEQFLTNSQPEGTYGLFNDKILLPMFPKEKKVQIVYYTKNCAKNSQGEEKLLLENADDESLIPEPFVEPLLVYGSCMRLKGNPQSIHFNYWLSMYKDALANLHSRVSAVVDNAPTVKMFRK